MLHIDFSGVKLKNKRLSKGWKQSELAEKAGFETSAICHFETNRRKPTAINMCKLANALDCDLKELVAGAISEKSVEDLRRLLC
jgi:transcriptional regulator with XRE-family HTH domain